MQEKLWFLSGVLFLLSYIPFFLDARKKPSNKATWMIWATLDGLTWYAMYQEGTANWMIAGATVGSTVLAITYLFVGERGWKRLDVACLIITILGIIVWWQSGNALVGLVTGLFLIEVGAIPIFSDTLKAPEKASKWAWTIMFVSCLLSLPAIPDWTFSQAAQPLVFFFNTVVMMLLIYANKTVNRALGWVRRHFLP